MNEITYSKLTTTIIFWQYGNSSYYNVKVKNNNTITKLLNIWINNRQYSYNEVKMYHISLLTKSIKLKKLLFWNKLKNKTQILYELVQLIYNQHIIISNGEILQNRDVKLTITLPNNITFVGIGKNKKQAKEKAASKALYYIKTQ